MSVDFFAAQLPATSPHRLAENVMHFARVLRTAGLPIGPSRVLDALKALEIAGIENRTDWYSVLRAVFVSRRDHQPIFDQAFAIFWRDPQLLERMMGLMLPTTFARGGQKQQEEANKRLAQALIPSQEQLKLREQQEEQVEVQTHLTFSAAERLQQMDFEDMSIEEWNEAKAVVRKLRLPIPPITTRRYQASHRGHIDLRATLRGMVRAGGELSDVKYRVRRKQPPPLVVLADISGSMHCYSRMLLYFLHTISNARQAGVSRVHVLLFGTRLTNVTRSLRERDADVAVKQVSGQVLDWAGGTRIYSSIRSFNFLWSRRLLGQNATVLLITDGLDREADDGLSEEMARLHRGCKQLIWLNPLLRYEGFEARPAGIRAMLPHVDLFLPVHNINSLVDLVATLSKDATRT